MHDPVAFDAMFDEGQIKGRIRLLLQVGRKRLGPPDADVESALKAIKDLERLERLGDAIFTVNSWRELLATP